MYEYYPKKKFNKQRILLILMIILGLGLSLGAVYYKYFYRDSRLNKLQSNIITIQYEEISVSINNQLPITDDTAMTQIPYIANITNTNDDPIDIVIKLNINETNTNMELSSIRYSLFINDNLIKKDNLHEEDNNILNLYTYKNLPKDGVLNIKLYFCTDYYYETPLKTFEAKIQIEGTSVDLIK